MKQRRLSFHGSAQELCQVVFTFHTALGLCCTSVQKSVYLERAILFVYPCTITTHLEGETLSSGHSFQDSSPSSYQVDSEHVIKSFILSSPKELFPPASFTKVPALADPWATCRRLFIHSLFVPLESPHKCLSLCVGDVRTEMKMTLHKVIRAWSGGSLAGAAARVLQQRHDYPSHQFGENHSLFWITTISALQEQALRLVPVEATERRMDFPSQSTLAFHPLFL